MIWPVGTRRRQPPGLRAPAYADALAEVLGPSASALVHQLDARAGHMLEHGRQLLGRWLDLVEP